VQQVFDFESFYLRRPRNMSNIPETSAIALPAEPAGISGVETLVAIATVDAPATKSMIPRTVCTFFM
jgi:hypothetical protein